MEEKTFDKLINHYKTSKNFELRENLSNSIFKMLQNTNPLLQDFKINGYNSHESLQQKQVFLTDLVRRAKVDISNLEINNKGLIKLKFHKMLGNLNSLLLGQYLIKTGLQISSQDLARIKSSDSKLLSKISQMQDHNLEHYNGFEMHQNILYKVSLIYGQKLFRLCLPSYLGREVIGKLHYKSEAHLSLQNFIAIFNQNLFSPNIDKLAKQTIQACIICKLNRNVYKKSTLGEKG